MTLVQVTLVQLCNGEETNTLFHYWKPAPGSDATLAEVRGLTEEVRDVISVALNSIQHSGVVNVAALGHAVFSGLSYTTTVPGAGARTLGIGNESLRSLFFNLKKNVGASLNPVTGIALPDQSRAIRSGRFLVPGVSDADQYNGHYDDQYIEPLMGALNLALVAPVTVSGVIWTPVVWGLALDAVGSLPARPECVAEIEEVQCVGLGNLRTRRSII